MVGVSAFKCIIRFRKESLTFTCYPLTNDNRRERPQSFTWPGVNYHEYPLVYNKTSVGGLVCSAAIRSPPFFTGTEGATS